MNKQLLNTLYVQEQETYLRLDHETVRLEGEEDFQVPLQHLGGITVFGNVLISSQLIHKCAEDGRSISWFSRGGRFRGRLDRPVSGNVLLRRAQHEQLSDESSIKHLARSFL
ncbi:MAG: CRISPR-associated endonuclease Cas1, partial [Candidatus Thermoplasmatota archaeon]|nr:CRISPR-associated endonuclease Cas1 [Candidatus Thermoplasmatota archaeon]